MALVAAPGHQSKSESKSTEVVASTKLCFSQGMPWAIMTMMFLVVFFIICMRWQPPLVVRSKVAFLDHLSSTTISSSTTSTTSTTITTSIFRLKHVSCLPGKPTILERSVKISNFCPEAFEVVFDVETTCSGAEFDGKLNCDGSDGGLMYFAHSVPQGDLDSLRYSLFFDCVRPAKCNFTTFNLVDHSFQRFFFPSEARTEAQMLADIQSARNSSTQIQKPCTGAIMNSPVSTAQLAGLASSNWQFIDAVDTHVSFDLRKVALQNEGQLAPLCAAWHAPLPSSGTWVSSQCLPHCRPGFDSQWLQDKYLWHPHGCRLQYVSHDAFLRVLKELGIAGIMMFGDSRQLHMHNELYLFLDGKGQMPGPKPPPSIVNSEFGDLPLQFIRHGYCRNSFQSEIQDVDLMIAETWGEVEDAELVSCFEGDDLENRARYLEMRHELMSKPGLGVIERTMSLLGPEVDLVIWTAGLHNVRCSLSNEVLLVHLKLEASIFKDWALTGLRLGKNRTIIYREEVGIFKTHPDPCVNKERLMSINRMAQSVVQDLDRDLQEHTLSQDIGRPVQARAVYLGAMMDMSMSRLDRIYDFAAHFYPGPSYQNSWQAFPRLVSSEMLLLLINTLQRLAAGVGSAPGLA